MPNVSPSWPRPCPPHRFIFHTPFWHPVLPLAPYVFPYMPGSLLPLPGIHSSLFKTQSCLSFSRKLPWSPLGCVISSGLCFLNTSLLSYVLVGEDHTFDSLAQSGPWVPLNSDLVKNGPLAFSTIVFHEYFLMHTSVPIWFFIVSHGPEFGLRWLSLICEIGWIMISLPTSQVVRILIPRTCKYVPLRAKVDFD